MSKYAIFALVQFILLNEIQCCCLPPPALSYGLPAAPALGCGLPALPAPTCALPAPPALGCAPPPLTILPVPMPVAPALPPTCGMPLLPKSLLLSKLLGLKLGLGGCGLPLPPLGCGC